MEADNINLLTLNEHFVILSEKTHKPYIDSDFSCYLFETRSDAQAFSKKIENTSVSEPKHLRQDIFCTEYYSYGIKNIKVKRRNKDTIIEIPVEKKDTKVQFYNSNANGLILRLKHTSKKKYLKALVNESFIAPILIDTRFPKHYPVIHYSYAIIQNKKYYILFSTVQEFEEWNKEQAQEWKGMELSISKFNRIRKTEPVLINPIRDKLILTHKQIKIILGG